MAECSKCNKKTIGDIKPVCTSCLFHSPPQNDETTVHPSGELGKAKSLHSVKTALFEAVQSEKLAIFTREQKGQSNLMKLKSNSIRSRTHLANSLILNFDENGIAEFKKSDLEEINKLLRARPGRFSIVEEVNKVESNEFLEQLDAARKSLNTYLKAKAVVEIDPIEKKPIVKPSKKKPGRPKKSKKKD